MLPRSATSCSCRVQLSQSVEDSGGHGLVDVLIDELSRVAGVVVIPRTELPPVQAVHLLEEDFGEPLHPGTEVFSDVYLQQLLEFVPGSGVLVASRLVDKCRDTDQGQRSDDALGLLRRLLLRGAERTLGARRQVDVADAGEDLCVVPVLDPLGSLDPIVDSVKHLGELKREVREEIVSAQERGGGSHSGTDVQTMDRAQGQKG